MNTHLCCLDLHMNVELWLQDTKHDRSPASIHHKADHALVDLFTLLDYDHAACVSVR